ncbi:hypothetical protein POX_e07120 [Penicillium oxalicum]|uniref:Uncharacterized protein n=1 Tax=Penicillium oxalicum (strain 114-2 / CGMCC 5302) TaxID=933388 RepID=S8B1C7_PENO1|nr:hypothetical protein POX_e07120 [Penicillium oxalicum]EPS28147.1 hypothetical protein PDE_03093 [Penicillium oxalicum 114-2]KAI2789092.1 hypothetical protein POX_e07120 [Penicillium oxalicum]
MAESPSGSSQFSASREIPFGVALFFSSDSGEKRHARLLRGELSGLDDQCMWREKSKTTERRPYIAVSGFQGKVTCMMQCKTPFLMIGQHRVDLGEEEGEQFQEKIRPPSKQGISPTP